MRLACRHACVDCQRTAPTYSALNAAPHHIQRHESNPNHLKFNSTEKELVGWRGRSQFSTFLVDSIRDAVYCSGIYLLCNQAANTRRRATESWLEFSNFGRRPFEHRLFQTATTYNTNIGANTSYWVFSTAWLELALAKRSLSPAPAFETQPPTTIPGSPGDFW